MTAQPVPDAVSHRRPADNRPMPMKEAAAVTSTLDPPTGGDVVFVPPVAGLDPSDLRHVPLALLAVAVRAGGLSGGLRPIRRRRGRPRGRDPGPHLR